MLTIGLFADVCDARRAQGQRYEFAPFLAAILLAVLSGATSFRKIAAFIELQRERLNELFGISWKNTPCYVAVRHLLLNVAPADLELALRRHSELLRENDVTQRNANTSKRFIALDGKALRGSAERLEDKRAQQLLSVFGHCDQIVLGQWEVDEKTNEIPVAQQIIAELGLAGCVLTLDALHCQKNTGSGKSTRRRRTGTSQSKPA
jgi:hypothetical protein